MNRSTIEDAIGELDKLLAGDVAVEAEYQSWFERHPVVMLALGFSRSVAHPRIAIDASKTLIPDFLVRTAGGAWEIFELKAPQTQVLIDRERRAHFYATFSSYVAQCQEYSEAFDDTAVRREFEKQNGFPVGKRPASTIVAGRSSGLDRIKTYSLANRFTPTIRHYTFDDILGQLEHYRTFHFGEYDSARGFALFFVLRLHPSPSAYLNNHIFDIGENPDRDHVEVFLNPQRYLRLVIYDSNGQRHDARSAVPLSEADLERVHYLYFDAGVGDRFGFLTIEIDGGYYADLKIQDFPFQLTDKYALGTTRLVAAPVGWTLLKSESTIGPWILPTKERCASMVLHVLLRKWWIPPRSSCASGETNSCRQLAILVSNGSFLKPAPYGCLTPKLSCGRIK